MRILPALAAALIGSLPALSHAYCFSIYTQRNQLVYQSTTTPVDLSRHISVGLGVRYPNHHLVFVPDESRCTEIGVLVTESRFAASGNAAGAEAGSLQPLRRRDRE